jgi:hypothetical protein
MVTHMRSAAKEATIRSMPIIYLLSCLGFAMLGGDLVDKSKDGQRYKQAQKSMMLRKENTITTRAHLAQRGNL